MIRDEDLKSSIDYSEGQKRAAHRVPDLMFPKEGHVGSVDVDIMVNHLTNVWRYPA
ncbi:MAG: hypothetical protein Q4C65_14470 [Eubacteriales bacterium]|nr:hypothetical protein [Eubacteriales bacterium]